jgi:hypothetical protein
MRTLQCLAIAITLASSVARAEDKPAAKEPAAKKTAGKADPSGTWTWTFQGPNGQSFEQTATFKVAGDKLTGSVSGRRGEAPISEGSFKDGKVTFAVARERDGRKMTSRYEGKVEADAGVIKGTSKISRGDGERTVPWEAKRK